MTTEFERGIQRLGYFLSEIMLILVLGIFILNVVFKRSVLDSLLFSVALAVGLTPQLLPAIIVTNLSKGSKLMGKAGVVVRRLAAIENFGSMNVLCMDKTGTITKRTVELEGAYSADGKPSDLVFKRSYQCELQAGFVNPLDEAIASARQLDISDFQKIGEVPYDFERKAPHDNCSGKLCYYKNFIYNHERCTRKCPRNLSSIHKTEILALIRLSWMSILALYRTWSEQGFSIGVARKDFPL